MKILSIIPARGGSKGLPGKNIRELCGHPLIAYSILAAQKSSFINRTIVSTDDEDIARVAKKYGAEVPLLRPAEYAQDKSSDLDVFHHILVWLEQQENYIPDLIVHLRPTSPIRLLKHIDSAIEKFIASNYDSLRVITDAPITPYKMWLLDENHNTMTPLIKQNEIFEPYNCSRHELPKVYWQIGYLDVVRRSTIIEKKSMSGSNILPYYVTPDFATDIDDINDFLSTETKMNSMACLKFNLSL